MADEEKRKPKCDLNVIKCPSCSSRRIRFLEAKPGCIKVQCRECDHAWRAL